jgi:hypothetical protein
MSNSGKIWDVKEVYKKIRDDNWSRGDIGVSSDSTSATFNKIQISTTGNAAAYGDLNTSDYNGGGVAGSTTRIVHGGGNQPSFSNAISYKEISHSGNFSDFGNLTTARQMLFGASNGNMAVFAGGRTPSNSNVIDRVGFSTLGDAVDFGDLTVARFGAGGMSSPTRAVFAGGGAPTNVIDFIDFASFGNATDFGDIGTTTNFNYFGASSSETRGVFGGGGDPSNTSIINFVTIASTGNSKDFGDLTVNRITMSAVGNSNRICFFSGQQNPAPAPGTDVIDFVTVATTGNATDFGDTTGNLGFKISGGSNGHGGIKLDDFQRLSVTYMPGSGRALFSGGQNPSVSTSIDMTMIKTKGNSSSFGTLATGMRSMSSASSLTRSLSAGGYSSDYTNAIRSVEFASQGNDSDFGDLIGERYDPQSGNVGNTTRGIFAGGHEKSGNAQDNVIQYITIATAGNATDFGDLSAGRQSMAGMTSNTRGVFAGGTSGPANVNIMEYITIASTSNVTDFGDLSAVRTEAGGLSSSTRGIIGGGDLGTPSILNIIEYITIASTSGTTDFGDLSASRQNMATGSDSITGVFAGGQAPSDSNVIDFITIASTGDAADFGDITSARRGLVGTSDSHGGLQA